MAATSHLDDDDDDDAILSFFLCNENESRSSYERVCEVAWESQQKSVIVLSLSVAFLGKPRYPLLLSNL